MRKKISKFYEVFRQIILDNKSMISQHKEFLEFVERGQLISQCTSDRELIKLAIISSHAEWELLYRVVKPEIKLLAGSSCFDDEIVLGSVARSITEEGQRFFNISHHELLLLRQEIIYGDDRYKRMLDTLRYWEKKYDEEPSYWNLRHIVGACIPLERVDQFKEFLNKIREQITSNQIAPIDYIIFGSIMSRKFDDLFDIDELRTILDLFEKHDDINKTLGIYNHVAYMNYWVDTISLYLRKIEDNLDYEFVWNNIPDCELQPHQIVNRFHAILANKEALDYEENLKLMKKHDELILKLIPLSTNPLDHYPIFKSTEVLKNHMLLNMSFPNKFEYFSDFENIAQSTFSSEYDLFVTKSQTLLKRLMEEFPEKEHVIRVNYAYTLACYGYYHDAITELSSLKDKVEEIKGIREYSLYMEALFDSYVALARWEEAYEIAKECIDCNLHMDYEQAISGIREAGMTNHANELEEKARQARLLA